MADNTCTIESNTDLIVNSDFTIPKNVTVNKTKYKITTIGAGCF